MKPNLTGVPETMLWTLHNRASEARRDDGVVRDPDCLRIYDSLDYDFVASFGRPEPSHGVRSAAFDAELEAFAGAHAGGTVVNLGEGLETQRHRLAHLDLDWVSVDLPEAIEIRERFIAPDARHRHVRCSVLDRTWLSEVSGPVHITAQGLLMYLAADSIAPLLSDLADHFPGGSMSRRTMRAGWRLTPSYTTPPMPFGISRPGLVRLVEGAVPGAKVREIAWRWPRGLGRVVIPVVQATPGLGSHTPAMWTITFPPRAR